jgi:hypothetical protein
LRPWVQPSVLPKSKKQKIQNKNKWGKRKKKPNKLKQRTLKNSALKR